jgi:hypothetical protein
MTIYSRHSSGAGEYAFYFIGADISRYVRFGRISWRKSLWYAITGPLLILIGIRYTDRASRAVLNGGSNFKTT